MTKHLRALTGSTLLLVCLPLGCGDTEEAPEDIPYAPCQVLAQLQGRAGGQIAGAPGTLAEFSIADGRVTSAVNTPCKQAVATRLDTSACAFCNRSPAMCEQLVRGIFSAPPLECSTCGDGTCLEVELATCPLDCASNCGDGTCEQRETASACPIDCATPCGDGLCTNGEDPNTCPQDCNFTVGNGICEIGENYDISPNDCGGQALGLPCASDADCRGAICNAEGICECNSQGGQCANSTCGDGFRQSYENGLNCPEDACQPALCSADTDAGCAGDARYTCVPGGEGGCPELVMQERCEFGCVGGQCLSCPTNLNLAFCDAPGRRCDETGSLILCEPLPGYAGCFYEERLSCAEVSGSTCVVDPEPGCAAIGPIAIIEVSPLSVRVGEPLTIYGQHFGEQESGPLRVAFAPDLPGTILSRQDGLLVVQVPPGAQSGPIVVSRGLAAQATSAPVEVLP